MSSPNISFQQIPSNIKVPGGYFEENTSNALNSLSGLNDKVCLIAQQLSTGSVAANTPTKVFSSADAKLYFGIGSAAAIAVEKIFEANPYTDLTVVGVADASGTKATGSIGVTGVCTVAGQLNYYVGDVGGSVAVNVGDTASAVSANLKSSLDQLQQDLMYTYTDSSGVISFTCRHFGTIGNQAVLTSSITASGTSLTTTTQFTNGATDPTIGPYSTPATTLAATVGSDYTIYISTLNDSTNLGYLKSMAAFVSGPIEQRPCVYVAGYTDKIGNLAAVKALALTLNDGRAGIGYATYATGYSAKSEAYKLACGYGAVLASANDPAVPYDGAPIIGLAAPAIGDRFTWTQKQDLLNNGVTPFAIIPGETMAIVRAISTYTVNSQSVPDPTLLDLTTIRTLDYVREQIRQRLTTKFQRAKLSDAIVALVRSETLDVLSLLEQLQIVQNVKQYAPGVICERDTQNIGQLDIKVPSNIVPGLHVIAGQIVLILS